jgi:RNA polymerase sigma factor (sigma-70 family)
MSCFAASASEYPFSSADLPLLAWTRRPCDLWAVDTAGELLTKLRKLLRSRGRSADDADDLIQEAFLRLQLYCREHIVQREEAFLVRTALNLSADQARQEHRVILEHGLLDKLPLIDPSPSPDAVYAAQRRLQHWKRGLLALSPRQREVFLLNRLEGYSFSQIATQLGISLSMVEKHAAKAVLSMTDWMDAED